MSNQSGTRLYLSGGEQTTWRNSLLEWGVKRLAFSYWGVRRSGKDFLLSEELPKDVKVIVEPGSFRGADLDDHVAGLHMMVENNLSRIEFAVEVSTSIGREAIEDNRSSFWDGLPPGKFAPVWRPGDTWDELERLASLYHRVALPAEALNHEPTTKKLRSLVNRFDVRLHAISGKLGVLADLPLETASTAAWTTTQKFGDLILWNGSKLKIYPRKRRELGLTTNRGLLHKEGYDIEKLGVNDRVESTKLAVHSILKMEATILRGIQPVPEVEDGVHQVVIPREVNRNVELRPRVPLPILQQRPNPDDEGGGDEIGVATMLRCDACHLASVCPEYRTGMSCAYEIPMRIRTRDEAQRVSRIMLEIQAQRVLHARFIEQMDGGFMQAEVGSEIDRYFRSAMAVKKLEEDRAALELHVRASTAHAEAGVLSRIFGSQIAAKQHELDEPIDAGVLAQSVLQPDLVDP